MVRNEYYKVKVKVARSCLALCDSMEVSLPGSSVHGILQARILEWAAISSSRESYRPRYRTWISCIAGRFFTVCSTRETCYKVSALVLLLLKTNDFHGEKHFFLMRTFFMLKTFICWVLFYESGSLLWVVKYSWFWWTMTPSPGWLCCCCSGIKSCPTLCDQRLQHTKPLCPSPSPRVCPSSCSLNWWCHPIISSSVTLFPFYWGQNVKISNMELGFQMKWEKEWDWKYFLEKELWNISKLIKKYLQIWRFSQPQGA